MTETKTAGDKLALISDTYKQSLTLSLGGKPVISVIPMITHRYLLFVIICDHKSKNLKTKITLFNCPDWLEMFIALHIKVTASEAPCNNENGIIW